MPSILDHYNDEKDISDIGSESRLSRHFGSTSWSKTLKGPRKHRSDISLIKSYIFCEDGELASPKMFDIAYLAFQISLC